MKATCVVLVMLALSAGTGTVSRAGTAYPQWTSDAGTGSRVRSAEQRVVALMREGRELSETFRTVAAALDESDGIIYVEWGRCFYGAPACLVGVAPSRQSRIVLIKVDQRRSKTDCDLIAYIGHELRHAVEVLSSPVTNAAGLYFFYSREGRKSATGFTFESKAAVEAERAIRAQIRRARACSARSTETTMRQ
jgi:hypothetical protein